MSSKLSYKRKRWKQKSHTLTIEMTPEFYDSLSLYAQKEGLDIAQVITSLLRNFKEVSRNSPLYLACLRAILKEHSTDELGVPQI